MTMRIGIVCPYDLGRPGGVQQLCLDLAHHLRLAGDDVALVGPGRSPDPGFRSVGEATTVRANRSRVPMALNPRAVNATVRALADVDVVHIHEPLVPLVGWAALSVSAPTVVTFHADPAKWTRRLYRAGSWLGLRLLRNTTITAVSRVAASALPPRWGPDEVVPNAISVADYHSGGDREPYRVVFLGRDEPRKGLDVLLAAWPRIRQAQPRAELLVMGASRHTGPDGVTFLGSVTEEAKKRHLASARFFVAPNLGGESFGIVLIEAMAAGCAVVASDLDAFAAVVGDAGRLVPVGDSEALATELIALMSDPTTVAQLTAAGAERVTRFDWAAVTAQYRALYARALGVGRRR